MFEYFLLILISIIVIYLISIVSHKLKLFDYPNHRKTHKMPYPYTGGISISCILILLIFYSDFKDNTLHILIMNSSLIAFAGFIDDKYKLNVGNKLIFQFIPIVLTINQTGLMLNSLGEYFLIGNITLGSFSLIFTILSIFLLINAFNYFDGIDGSLGTTTISILIINLYLIYENNIIYLNKLIICFISIIVVFLFFNLSKINKIKTFLGDSGSLLLGFLISFLLIYIEKNLHVHPILLAFSISLIVFDFLSVNILRAINNKKIFKPNLDHIHHRLFQANNSIFLTNLILILINLIFFILGLLSFNYVNSLFSLFIFLLSFMTYFLVRLKYK